MKADPMLDAASRLAAPAELEGDGGRITPGKGSALFTVFGSVVLAAIVFPSAHASASWIGAVLLLPGVFMLPSLTRWHDVRWDDFGVYGTSRMFGPTLGWARTKMAWREIVRVGRTLTGYWYVQAEDGRRVYWSYLYPGYPLLVARLRQACPDLDLGAAEGLE